MLKDKIENKIQLQKQVELTWANLQNMGHKTGITLLKANKKFYKTQFSINHMLESEIKKKSIKNMT